MANDKCPCLRGHVYSDFEQRFVGVDTQEGRFGEVSIWTCRRCGRPWLHYLYEHEAFTASGRWWHGPLSPAAAKKMTPKAALNTFAALDFYFVGGSYYGGQVHRVRGAIGPIIP